MELRRFNQLPRKQRRIAAFDDLHLAKHRTNDDLDVLVVDVDALRPVDLLHFLHEIVLQRGLTLYAENVVRIERAFVELISRQDLLTILDQQVRAWRISYSCSSPLESATKTVRLFRSS